MREETLFEKQARLQRELNGVNRDIENRWKNCRHQWGKVEYCPIVRGGYQDSGDPEGTMGIDRKLPCWIHREETPQWKRKCNDCGLVQTTQMTKTEVQGSDIPGCTVTKTVAKFYDSI